MRLNLSRSSMMAVALVILAFAFAILAFALTLAFLILAFAFVTTTVIVRLIASLTSVIVTSRRTCVVRILKQRCGHSTKVESVVLTHLARAAVKVSLVQC